MKEVLLDILKWSSIIVIALLVGGLVFYVVYPKYHFTETENMLFVRGNKITGKVEYAHGVHEWRELGRHLSFEEMVESIIAGLPYVDQPERKALMKVALGLKEESIMPTEEHLRYALEKYREKQKKSEKE